MIILTDIDAELIKLAEKYIPIKLSDCALIRKRKLADRERLIKDIQSIYGDRSGIF